MRKPREGESKKDYVESMMVADDLRQAYPNGEARRSFLEQSFDAAQDRGKVVAAPVTLDTFKGEEPAVEEADEPEVSDEPEASDEDD